MYCRKCGTEIPDDSAFCVKCGTPVEVISEQKQITEQKDDIVPPEQIIEQKENVVVPNSTVNPTQGKRKKELGVFHKLVWFGLLPFQLIYGVIQAVSYYKISTVGFVLAIVSIVWSGLIFIGFFKKRKYAWVMVILDAIGRIILSYSSFQSAYEHATTYSMYYSSATIAGEFFGSVIGVLMNIAIVIYYWRRRSLFGAHKNV